MTAPVVDTDLLATLPPVLRAVVKALGFARAREFLLAHGGVNVTIAKRHSRTLGLQGDELARMRENLKLHLDHNDRVWLPKADKLLQMVRNAQIKREAYDKSIRDQARMYDLSSRQITNIRRENDGDTRQIDLF